MGLILRKEGSKALALYVPERTQWHARSWMCNLLRALDGEFDRGVVAATKARSTPTVQGWCVQSCVSRLFSTSVWSPLRLRDLVSSTLDAKVTSRAQALTAAPSSATAVRLMAAVMATPPMGAS